MTTAAGTVYPYDELVVATGSDAARLPIPGSELTHVYRTLEDVWAINKAIAELTEKLGRKVNAVTIGGGLLGLESAAGTEQLGATPIVINGSPWLMNTQLDEGAGQALGRLIEAKGFTVHGGVFPSEVLSDDDGQVTGVLMADGRIIDADLVIVAIGVKPRDELFRTANGHGEAGRARSCSTSARAAASSSPTAAKRRSPASGRSARSPTSAACAWASWPRPTPWRRSSRTGCTAATRPSRASTPPPSSSSPASTSPASATPSPGPSTRWKSSTPTRPAASTRRSSPRTMPRPCWAASSSATPPRTRRLRPMLGRELAAEPGAYLTAAGGGDAPETELPDDAILCSCNNVSAGTIRDTVNGCGACDGNAPVQELGELKGCTRAGTSCGSCVPMLKKLLETELTKSGVEVSKALCEHIELSRQELFETIRVLELTSFEEVMAKYGTGAGCDICKPTIANILASQNSAYVLDAGRGTLQDTNDRALANMQKDGTYSVVPRIAGGEITPKKLGVIAAVAEKYSLYTKITGGQRIDMFGARLEQLPEIWKELVDAGFESGQAYGKSLRTVKSCVGSTWCRFGVQDSVAMAIQLELRYRGLRSPHKLKMGVSGCARECAEARGKDVGVIATADGWNLYVGGNGGATPAHAQLLAKDLDDETLIKYIDRYFMYYIRTADRLQRTARWQEELDGGIKHVEDVVVHDTLGIAEDLEAAMAKHVDTYVDEWADTLKDPERLRRFRSFVNAPDQKDDSITFVPDERGQMRPATAEEKALAGQQPVLIGASIPVRATTPELLTRTRYSHAAHH